MSERLKWQGRLAEDELEARKLRLKIEGLRDGIRDKLDPLDEVGGLDADVVAEAAVALAVAHGDYLATLARIYKAKRLLGRS